MDLQSSMQSTIGRVQILALGEASDSHSQATGDGQKKTSYLEFQGPTALALAMSRDRDDNDRDR